MTVPFKHFLGLCLLRGASLSLNARAARIYIIFVRKDIGTMGTLNNVVRYIEDTLTFMMHHVWPCAGLPEHAIAEPMRPVDRRVAPEERGRGLHRQVQRDLQDSCL